MWFLKKEKSTAVCDVNNNSCQAILHKRVGGGERNTPKCGPVTPIPAVVITRQPMRTRRTGVFEKLRPIGSNGALYHGEIKVVVRAHECA